jgi:hypothetical protein
VAVLDVRGRFRATAPRTQAGGPVAAGRVRPHPGPPISTGRPRGRFPPAPDRRPGSRPRTDGARRRARCLCRRGASTARSRSARAGRREMAVRGTARSRGGGDLDLAATGRPAASRARRTRGADSSSDVEGRAWSGPLVADVQGSATFQSGGPGTGRAFGLVADADDLQWRGARIGASAVAGGVRRTRRPSSTLRR